MIAAGAGTYEALQARKLALRVRVFWRVNSRTPGIDITDRVVQPIATISRTLAPFLAGFSSSGTTLTLRNDDGRLTTGADGAYLRNGPRGYNLTEIVIEQGIASGPGGEFEYFDVFTGSVEWVRYRVGELEVKIASKTDVLRQIPMPEEYSFGNYSSAAYPRTLALFFTNAVSVYTPYTAADVGGADYNFAHGVMEDLGWNVAGSFGRGASFGKAWEEFARSHLMTLAELEDGRFTYLSEILPRTASNDRTASATTFHFDEKNAVGWELVPGMRSTATEVVVEYAGSSVSYRDSADETTYGWIPASVSMPFLRSGAAAAWSARLIYEHHKQFPHVMSFSTFGHGILVQLNDRVQVTDPFTETTQTARVVSKVWRPDSVSLGVIVDPSESSIVEGTFGQYDGTDWDDSTDIAL